VIGVGAGLPAAGVNALAAAGDLVEVATDGGLARVDAGGRVQPGVTLPGRRVTALAAGYIGAWPGLYRRGASARVPGSADLRVTALLECGRDLYVGTQDHGLLALRDGALAAVPGLPAVRVGGLAGCGRPAGVHAATTAGLFTVARGVAQPVAAWPRHATTVAVAGGAVVVGTYGEGVRRLGPGAAALLPGAHVALLHREPRGVLAGTDEGLVVLRDGAPPAAVPLDGPPPGPVTAVAVAGGDLWVGTFDRGLALLRDGSFRPAPVHDERITAIAVDARGRPWVGTPRGLARGEGERFAPVADPRGWLGRHVNAVRRHGDELVVAVHPGLVVIDPAHDPPRFRYYGARGHEADVGLVGPTVYGVAVARGALWVGTDDGLTQLAAAGPRDLTDLGDVLPDNWINDVRARRDEVYVLTLRSGFLRLAPWRTDVIATSLMTSPGVLLPLGERVLFGTNTHGLAVADVPPGGAAHIRTFGPGEGLASRLVTALAFDPTRDRLWIGGAAGLDRLDDARRALARGAREVP
jgi:hypothetical protein